MQAFIAALGEATERAEDAVGRLRAASREVASSGHDQERRARQLSEELARLMQNAARVVKRLDAAVEKGATRAAEMRTLAGSRARPAGTAAAGSEAWPEESPPPRRPARQAPAPAARPVRPVRREGQLDGLLHGELLEALQALR
jgi:hypothetical protein